MNAERIVKNQEPGDFWSKVKWFCPWTGATRLLTELQSDDPCIAFWRCDLGMGFSELGSVSLMEIKAAHRPDGFAIERDHYFGADYAIRCLQVRRVQKDVPREQEISAQCKTPHVHYTRRELTTYKAVAVSRSCFAASITPSPAD